MIIFKRLSPYWSSAGVLIILWYGINNPFYWSKVVISLVMLVAFTIAVMRQPNWRLEYLGLSITPILLTLSAFSFILIQEEKIIIYGILAITTIAYFLFIKHLAVFLFLPKKYIPFSLEHISTYNNLIASFYTYVSIFMLTILGIGRLRYVITFTLVVTILLVWQTFWIQKISSKQIYPYIIVISLIITEGAWALHYWPVSFFVTGFILTIGLYLLLNLSRYYLTNTYTNKILRRYLLISGLALIVLVVTTQWFI